jgi:hypothetical protein
VVVVTLLLSRALFFIFDFSHSGIYHSELLHQLGWLIV